MRQGFLIVFLLFNFFWQKKAPQCKGVDSNFCAQIATFNLEFFPLGKEKKLRPQQVNYRMKEVSHLWQKSGFDIVAAQEVYDDKNLIDTFIKKYLNNEFAYVMGNSGPYEQKLAIFYRRSLFLLLNSQELNKLNTQGIIDEDKFHWQSPLRLPLQAKFRNIGSNFTFLLITIHLKSGSDAKSCDIRKRQVQDLAKYIRLKKEALILAGDFNDTLPKTGICENVDTLESLEKLEENQNFFFVTWPGKGIEKNAVSFFSRNYRSLIDHIYISQSLKKRLVPLYSYWAEVVSHDNPYLSDHQPVVVWLYLMDSAP